jgi:endonuclease/exonuclease/phosphatase family metal-dependent hydrolase
MLQHLTLVAMMMAAMSPGDKPQAVRFATFNVWELSTQKLDQVDERGVGANVQLRKAAEIVQRIRPDVLLVNEIDFDAERRQVPRKLLDCYLKVGQEGQRPIDYPHVYFEPVNTGVPTGLDLDNDGKPGGPADAYGFGRYPGQYGMALFSRYPIESEAARTFQLFLWKDMPNNLMPDGQAGKPPWYSPEEVAVLRLSSKSHWDVPIRIGDAVVHVLASHPTPPVFDGPEDRNGRRAYDEIRLWADYLAGGLPTEYLVDDRGRRGGLGADALFVIMGDLNADPVRAGRAYGGPAIEQLLLHPRVQDPQPASAGALTGSAERPPEWHRHRTADFGRVDYVLPSVGLEVRDCGVYWPAPDSPEHRLVAKPTPSSDHRLVWVDVVVPRSR